MEQTFQVGIYTATHGIRGEIRVYPTTDSLERFKELKDVLLDTKEGLTPLTVKSVRFQKGMVLMAFEGIDNINQIEKWRGSPILVTRENAAALPEGRFFIADLIGLPVLTDDGRTLGRLTAVLQTGANDVFEVKGEAKDYLLPYIADCVLEVSPEKGRILVHMMDGLEEL